MAPTPPTPDPLRCPRCRRLYTKIRPVRVPGGARISKVAVYDRDARGQWIPASKIEVCIHCAILAGIPDPSKLNPALFQKSSTTVH